ncbi:polysaccharide biosynthesis/export family protein [Desertivirga xinjiangensis]|uniref:polysaccharide biosynthesis/export family protein n=1 Tax=Desertivirga xinjiangensis TaxID=539206 RepID=UPI00210D0723|nr:polysaccharide biosynthesis/export family protein [Pedobacter xinjiangensis]
MKDIYLKALKKIGVLSILSISACAPQRDLVYFSDMTKKGAGNDIIINSIEPRIQSSDLLNITVNSPSAESNVLFAANYNTPAGNGDYELVGYRVNKNGNINFPVLGNVKLEGFTIEQAQQELTRELKNYVKNPIVNIQFLNFKVTVIGEVNNPSTFTVTNDKITLLEALGMAGDMTAYGKRENVLIIRENNAKRTMVRVNLNKKDVLSSPYFYLKQNDVVYVEPDKAKSMEISRNNRLMPLIVASISAAAVIATTFLRR